MSDGYSWHLAAAAVAGIAFGYVLAKTHPAPETATAPALKRDFRAPSKKVCLVTGGSRGIGAAVCERLAADGYKVAVNYRSNKEQADEVVKRIRSQGGIAVAVQGDVANQQEVPQLFDMVSAQLGAVPTAVVNNAGLLGPLTGLTDDATLGELGRVMGTNLYGVLHVLQEVAKRMQPGGAVVNVSAGSAYTGQPLAYAMSKGALNSLTAGCVPELAGLGIRINTVSPGPVYTDMMGDFDQVARDQMAAAIPLARAGEPGEVAAGISWLLSDDASFVSGANLRIAGGKPLEA